MANEVSSDFQKSTQNAVADALASLGNDGTLEVAEIPESQDILVDDDRESILEDVEEEAGAQEPESEETSENTEEASEESEDVFTAEFGYTKEDLHAAADLYDGLTGEDADLILARLAKQRGLKLISERGESATDDSAPAEAPKVTPNVKAAERFKQKLVGRLGERFEFLADPIGDLIAEALEEAKQETSAFKQELQANRQVESNRNILATYLRENNISEDMSKDPVAKQISIEAQDFPYTGNIPYERYISKLHKLAISSLGTTAPPASMESRRRKIQQNRQAAEPVAVASQNDKSAPNKRPANYSFKDGVRDALAGVVYDD